MQISEQGVLAGLATLTAVALVLVVIISWLNVALGLQTLAILVALWSFFFGLIYAGLFAYNAAVGGVTSAGSAVRDGAAAGEASALTPLSDDFLRALDDQLKVQDPDGVASPFRGDSV